MTDKVSEPAREWEYRNFLCRVYQLGQLKVVGYVRVGDEWTQVEETENVESDVKSQVEHEVDRIIREAIRDEANKLDWPFDDPVDPNPGIDPIDPNPNPNPYPPNDDPFDPGPTWMSIAGIPVVTTGTASIRTTNGTSTLVSLSDLDADDVTDDGLLDR